jgi:hypothetical protein
MIVTPYILRERKAKFYFSKFRILGFVIFNQSHFRIPLTSFFLTKVKGGNKGLTAADPTRCFRTAFSLLNAKNPKCP